MELRSTVQLLAEIMGECSWRGLRYESGSLQDQVLDNGCPACRALMQLAGVLAERENKCVQDSCKQPQARFEQGV